MRYLLIPAGLCLIGLWSLPYGYYKFLSLVVFIFSLYGVNYHQYSKGIQKIHIWIFLLIAILYNPLIPIHFSKKIWMKIDIIISMIFICYALQDIPIAKLKRLIFKENISNNLIFKSTTAAFEYIVKFFTKPPLSKNQLFYGLIVYANKSVWPERYELKISTENKEEFDEILVEGLMEPSTNLDINDGDLVLWKCIDPGTVILSADLLKIKGASTGFMMASISGTSKTPKGILIHKIKPELNIKTNKFSIQ